MRDLPPMLDYARRGHAARPLLSEDDRGLLRAGCLSMLVGGGVLCGVSFVAIVLVHACCEWWWAGG